jgi:transcriptional regulator with XRE-family HTH domain
MTTHLTAARTAGSEATMALPVQIKNLRKEHGWSQADLATRVGGDAGQISRYENGKITPSVEAVIRLAEIFDVSTDFLLLHNVPRRPYRAPADPLLDRLADRDTLTDADRAALRHILDCLLANTRIRAALNNEG